MVEYDKFTITGIGRAIDGSISVIKDEGHSNIEQFAIIIVIKISSQREN